MGKPGKAKTESSRSLFRKQSKQQKDPSISKLQLSLLNSGLMNVADGEKAMTLVQQKPIELYKFPKHLEHLRKYDILLKTEYQSCGYHIRKIKHSTAVLAGRECGMQHNFVTWYSMIIIMLANTLAVIHIGFKNTPIEKNMYTGVFENCDIMENLTSYLESAHSIKVATKGESHSMRHALKATNEPKNSYKKLVPYDYNRIVLDSVQGVPDSDFINASYIDSILKPNAYIAAQGPNENTIADFWRMVWEQNCYVIVMLTKVFDFIRVMCVQYWPTEINHPEMYGDLEMTLMSEEMLANFLIRTVQIRKGNEIRDVTQLHYTNWPSHTCPFSSALLEFRRRVRVYMSHHLNCGPVVVHCSDGCGRTGTYLCIDANLELAEEDNVYDVFGYTKRLRQARKGMVENVDHYRFIYETLEEAYICGSTWFSVTQISQQLKHKSMKNPITKQNEYQREYEKICKMAAKLSIGDCAGGHRPENREKNRDVAIVPPDNFRPYLTSFQSNDNTDYINAVFIDGYTRSKEYIVTEWPLQKTVADFWSMVYDHECNSVIVLCNPIPSNAFPPFWPTEREKRKKYGPVFTVELISYNHYPNIKTWIFKVLKKIVSLTELMAGVKAEPKTTQLFQLTCWPAGHKVPTSTNALVELMNMVERWRQRTVYGPVVVLSANGKSRVGVYCAANVATEQVVQHREVDIFQAVKTVRRHRPQLVENMTEYKYCYDVVLHYILHYLRKE